MQQLTQRVFALSPPGGLFDGTVVRNLFPDLTRGARDQLVHRALRRREVLRLTDGRYCLAGPFRKTHPHPFIVAAFIRYPSHVSFESALAHHGLIPEAVQGVACACSQRSRVFDTPLGRFSYHRVPAADSLAGVVSVEIERGSWVFLATPLRAIADLVYLRKEVRWDRDGIGFLEESLRIESHDLGQLSLDTLDEVCSSIRSRRTREFLTGLAKVVRS